MSFCVLFVLFVFLKGSILLVFVGVVGSSVFGPVYL